MGIIPEIPLRQTTRALQAGPGDPDDRPIPVDSPSPSGYIIIVDMTGSREVQAMLTAITLVVLAVVCRLLTPVLHGWNFVPMGALALYAGARLPRRWAWVVPIVAM